MGILRAGIFQTEIRQAELRRPAAAAVLSSTAIHSLTTPFADYENEKLYAESQYAGGAAVY